MNTKTVRLIVALIVFPFLASSLQAEGTNAFFALQQTITSDTQQDSAKPKTVFLWCVVIASAAYVVYAVNKCRIAAGLTNSPTPPSDSPPSGTNHIVFSPHDLTPPGSGGSITPVLVPGIYYPNVTLATNNEDNTASLWDISTNGWTDPNGFPYTWLYLTHTDPTGPHIQESTNLTDWHDVYFNVAIWFSSTITPDPNKDFVTNIMTVVSDGNGVPIFTNFAPISAISNTNRMGVPRLASQMYFRGITP